MGKDLLKKHQNDPAWVEVIRLYSGLFDTQDERETFILDLADKDILLAAECKTSSLEEEKGIQTTIIKRVKNKPLFKQIPIFVELRDFSLLTPSLNNLKAIFDYRLKNTNADNLSYITENVLSITNEWFFQKSKQKQLFDKTHLHLLVQILTYSFDVINENKNLLKYAQSILDLLFTNIQSFSTKIDVIGIPHLKRSLKLFVLFEYKKVDFALLIKPILEGKQSSKKEELEKKINNILSNN